MIAVTANAVGVARALIGLRVMHSYSVVTAVIVSVEEVSHSAVALGVAAETRITLIFAVVDPVFVAVQICLHISDHEIRFIKYPKIIEYSSFIFEWCCFAGFF